MAGTLLIIDGLNLIYRAYHAFPDTLVTPTGAPANALHGTVIMLAAAWRHFKPLSLVIASERGRCWRHEAWPDYKGGRASRPDALAAQLPHLAKIMWALGLTLIYRDGHEADDVIASLAYDASARGRDVVVLSNDHDLLQLVRPGVRVVAGLGHNAYEERDDAWVERKYGIRPSQVADYKALVGDTSDNYPGVTGIGPVTAQRLLHQYGSLYEVLLAAEGMGPGKTRTRLIEQAEQARLCYRLALLNWTLSLDATGWSDHGRWGEVHDRPALVNLFRSLGLERLLPLTRREEVAA